MLDAVVVGAGPSGLATSRELSRKGICHRVLERGPGPGHSWTRLYDSMRLHTGKHLSGLPGMPLPPSAPLFVPAPGFLEYLRAYAERLEVPVETGCEVRSAERRRGPAGEERWVLETSGGRIEARALVLATGVMSNPRIPDIPGLEEFEGTVRHSIEYRRPDPFMGRRVLVVGAGNSAGEIAPELARAGAEVTVSIRSGADVVPLRILGVPIQYVAWVVLKLPERIRAPLVRGFRAFVRVVRGAPPFPPAKGGPLERVPLIGYGLVDAVREGRIRLRGRVERLTPEGARFRPPGPGLASGGDAKDLEVPFDDLIFATGFRPALGPVEGLVRCDDDGFALRTDRVTSADAPGLYLVGHNYDATGGLANIRRDAPLAAEAIQTYLSKGRDPSMDPAEA